MSRILTLAGIVSLLLAAGCGDSSEKPAETQDQRQWKVVQGVLDKNQELADTLTSIKDVESAKAAVPKLKAAIASLKAAGKKMETLAEPTEAMKKRMDKEFAPALATSQAAFAAQVERIEKMPEAMKVIAPVLKSLEE